MHYIQHSANDSGFKEIANSCINLMHLIVNKLTRHNMHDSSHNMFTPCKWIYGLQLCGLLLHAMYFLVFLHTTGYCFTLLTNKVLDDSCHVNRRAGPDTKMMGALPQISQKPSHGEQNASSCWPGQRLLFLLPSSSRHAILLNLRQTGNEAYKIPDFCKTYRKYLTLM